MSCAACAPGVDAEFASGCACDHEGFPPCETIAPGLSSLPAQALGFPEFREHLLSTASGRTELAGWGARAEDDLGVMLLESWAYVLDVVQFYDRRIAEESYLRTARDPAALRRLVGLLGYRPRPAVAASVTLAAVASGREPVDVPVGTAIRSKAAPGVPPQVFETSVPARADPRTNGWDLAPLRPAAFDGLIAFAPGAPGVLPDQVVGITLNGSPSGAARVAEVRGRPMPDGADYRVATLPDIPASLVGQPLASIALFAMSQSAAPSRFAPLTGTASTAASRTEWVLDSVYPQIAAGDLVVLESGGSLTAARVHDATIADIQLGTATNPVAGKATKLTFAASYPMTRVHFRAVAAGRLINPALATVAAETLLAPLAAAGPAPALGDAPAPTELLALGQGDSGLLLAGSVSIGNHGSATLSATAIVERGTDLLAAPVRYHGNLLEATRGQSVRDEVLGSADSSRAYQRFRLKKKPLTYRADGSGAGGVAPELEVRVNSLLWKRVESFLAARPGERVYIVRHDEAGETDIVFGDLVRPTTGVGNVTASYRFGAGKAVPPPGKLVQLVNRLPGLARILAPLAARGGADGESPAALKTNAPRSALTYGRAVSLADHAAIVAAQPGVIASDVQWAWVEGGQRAGVRAWILCDGGDVSADVEAMLVQAGHPLVPVSVRLALPDSRQMNVAVAVEQAHPTAQVVAAVRAALENPDTGLLAPRHAAIGGALFRSRIAGAVAAVDGVADVLTITVDGSDMPAALSAAQGRYLAFAITVGGS